MRLRALLHCDKRRVFGYRPEFERRTRFSLFPSLRSGDI